MSFRLLPARNISDANSGMLMPAMSASASAAALSRNVHVGDRNISVSEMMAAQSSPAMFGAISSSFFLINFIHNRSRAAHRLIAEHNRRHRLK